MNKKTFRLQCYDFLIFVAAVVAVVVVTGGAVVVVLVDVVNGHVQRPQHHALA